MQAIRALYFRQATEIEATIKSQCRQADELWAHIRALDATLKERLDVSEVKATLFATKFDLDIVLLQAKGGE
jgi:hypothetical protein